MHVEHLDVGELVEDRAGREAAGELAQVGAKGAMQAVGHEGDEDMGFDTMLPLMEDRPQLEIVLEVLEGGLDLDELDENCHSWAGWRPDRLLRKRYQPSRRRTWRSLLRFKA